MSQISSLSHGVSMFFFKNSTMNWVCDTCGVRVYSSKSPPIGIYSQLLNPTEILVPVKGDSSDDFGSGRGAHSPPRERFSKVRAGSEHLQGLTLPCSHRVEIQLTQLEPFVLLQQLFRLMPLRIYYFMFWADTEAIFWSKMEFVLVSSSTVSP